MFICFSYTSIALFANKTIHVYHAVYKSSSILGINKVYFPKTRSVTYELRLATRPITQ
jgi:hypothetical protein